MENQKGRPKTRNYTDVAEFLWEFERLKLKYLIDQAVVDTLLTSTYTKINPYDTGLTFTSGLEEQPVIKKKRHNVGLICSLCGFIDSAKVALNVDLDHDPPRIRYTLHCGHRNERIVHNLWNPKQCPKCGGAIQRDEDEFLFCVKCGWKQGDFGE